MASYSGSFLVVAPSRLAGWVWNSESPDTRSFVEIYVNGKCVERLVSDNLRPDLIESGIGDGHYAFFLELSQYLLEGDNVLSVVADEQFELAYNNNIVSVQGRDKFPIFDLLSAKGLTLRRTRFGNLLLNGKDQGVDEALLEYGEWGIDEAKLFQKLLSKGDVALDVGANLGASALPMSASVGASGQVICFEPQRYNFFRLCAHALLNGAENISPRNIAVGETHGAKVSVPTIDYCDAHSSGTVSLVSSRAGCYSVDSVSLTAFCKEEGVSPKLIKIDVEGFERAVVSGALGLIEKVSPYIYFECHGQEDFISITEMILGCNSEYRFYWHVARIFDKDNFNASNRDIYGGDGLSFNVLAAVTSVEISQPGFVSVSSLREFWPEDAFPSGFHRKIRIIKSQSII